MIAATCSHSRPDDLSDELRGLPCPWPGCPEGTPKERVAVMEGNAGSLRMRAGVRYEIEADGGVRLWERARSGDGWTWKLVAG